MDVKSPDQDEVDGFYFNGPTTIRNKVKLAQSSGLAGVMIWETGQDCRVNAVTWGAYQSKHLPIHIIYTHTHTQVTQRMV